MKTRHVTGLGRPVDFDYPSNRHAVIGMLGAGLVAFAYSFFVDDNPDLLDPLGVAISAFLGWALGRELDPDRNVTGLVALGLAALLAIWQLPALLLVGAALVGLRTVVGTVGRNPTYVDMMVLLAATGYAATRAEGWAIQLILIIAILVSGIEGNRAWAAAAVLVGFGAWLIWPPVENLTNDVSYKFLLLPILAVIILVLFRRPSVASLTDVGHQPISVNRLRGARVLAGVAVAVAVLASDASGLAELGPLTAAVLATSVSVLFSDRTHSG